MPASRIYLSGGPCDGRTVPATQIQGSLVAYIACGGGYYVLNGDKRRPNGDLIFGYAGKTKPGPPQTGTLKAPQALKGWKALRKGYNRELPAAISYMERGNSAALRALARARKVRL